MQLSPVAAVSLCFHLGWFLVILQPVILQTSHSEASFTNIHSSRHIQAFTCSKCSGGQILSHMHPSYLTTPQPSHVAQGRSSWGFKQTMVLVINSKQDSGLDTFWSQSPLLLMWLVRAFSTRSIQDCCLNQHSSMSSRCFGLPTPISPGQHVSVTSGLLLLMLCTFVSQLFMWRLPFFPLLFILSAATENVAT